MTLEEILSQIHSELAETMLCILQKKDEDGNSIPPSAAEMNTIRQFLRDNGIDGVAKKESPLGKLANELPSFDDEGEHTVTH